MNRPDALEAVTPALKHALADMWNHLAPDREARAVVLTRAGRGLSCRGGVIISRQ